MKMTGFAVFFLVFLLLILAAACTNSIVKLPIGIDWLSSETLQQIGIIVDLMNPDKTVNDQGFADMQAKYGVDLKTPYDAFVQATQDLKTALIALKDAMGKTRGLTPEEERLKEAIEQLDIRPIDKATARPKSKPDDSWKELRLLTKESRK